MSADYKKLARSILVLLLCAAQINAFGQEKILLPNIGDPSGTVITPVEEKELGDAFFRSLHSQLDINQDPEIQQYIQSLGEKLAANSDAPGQPFHFFVVTDPMVNAFAGPGGYIGVNSGLILTSESESELASVLAHEIAHVTQRHLYQTFQAAGRLSLPLAAAMLAAILLGTRSSELAQAALIAAQAGSAQYQINFTRDNEQEADRVGIQILAQAGYDPHSMPTFFERLQQSNRYFGQELPEFLRTHPVTVSRIADTRGRAEQYPYRQYPDSLNYQIAKAKLRALTPKNPAAAIGSFKAQLNQGTPSQQAIAHYGLAVSLQRTGDYAQAKEILQKLLQQFPEQLQFINALAKSELGLRHYDRAVQLYEQTLQRFPGNRIITLEYADALLEMEEPGKARQLLQEYSYAHRATPPIYELIARAYGDLGNEAEAHRYLAEYHYLMGETEAAIRQAEIALKAAGDNYYLTAIVKERLKKFKAEQEERKKR